MIWNRLRLITVFRSNFRCHVLIISGKGDEGPKDKKRKEVMSVLEKVEVLPKLTRGMRIAAVNVIMVSVIRGSISETGGINSLITTTSRTCSDRSCLWYAH